MFYKYRGVKEFRYFADIVLKKRLYAAPYFELNDPMEGHYLYSSGELDSDVRDRIKSQKEKLRICSLSKVADNELMWSHYAEGHRGVAIGVSVNESKYEVIPVNYDGPLQLVRNGIHNSTAQDILSHKLDVWSYEKEARIFVRGKHYVYVNVKEIILGRRMSKQDVGFIKSLVARIDPKIKVEIAPNRYV